MLNNSITIGLAVISLVCIYLIWENFRQSAKLRYLESSIHETVQTVQGLINNSLTLPPMSRNEANHNYHPEPIRGNINPSMINKNNSNSNTTVPIPVASPQLSTSEKKAMEKLSEDIDLESVTEEVDNEIQELEPLVMTEELKTKIDSLHFSEPNGTEHHNHEDSEDSGDDGVEELEEHIDIEEFDESVNDNNIDSIENVEITELPDEINTNTVEEVEGEGEEEVVEDEVVENYVKNPNLLNDMSLKELREIAEKHNLGHRGTKEQLITKIKRNINMNGN
jgi:hypothetical protein